MNHPKTNTYPKHYEISGDLIVTGTISPKPWYPVFATQVDIILSTYDNHKYHSQATNKCLPSCLQIWFCDMGLHLPQLRFLEHLNRPIDIESFVSPEDIYHEIHGCICKHGNFEMGNWKVFNASYNALHHKPWHLEQNEGFSEPVALSPVFDFCFGWHGEWVDVIMCEITHEQRWSPPIMIKNLFVVDHHWSNNKLLKIIAIY